MSAEAASAAPELRAAIAASPLTKELHEFFPDAKIVTVKELTDDLEAIYKEDNSRAAQNFRKQLTQNEIYIEKFLKQKGLKK